MIDSTSAIVLAGGRSRRLGRDKRTLRFATERTQLDETIARVRDVADDVVIAGALDLASDRFPDVRWIPDAARDAGPLAGLVAGLEAARHEYALAVACDLPLLDVRLLQALAGWPREYDLLVPRRTNGTLEMLHAIYRKSCLPIATQRLQGGRLKLAGLPEAARSEGLVVRYVDEDEITHLNPGLTSFFNVNTPDELEHAQALIAAIGYESCESPGSPRRSYVASLRVEKSEVVIT